MKPIALHLLGNPRLLVAGNDVEIRPRAAFEVLAALILAGEHGITREAVVGRFWSHMEPKEARASLRIALHKLRLELSRIAIADQFDLSGETLRFTGRAVVDLHADLDSISQEELTAMLKPLANGWDTEHWLTERDGFGEALAKAFARRDMSGQMPELSRAIRAYPTTTRLYVILAAHLQSQGRDAELNELVITFEDRWVDRFGTGDIPDVKRLLMERTAPPEPSSTRRARTWQVTVAAAFLLAAYLAISAWFGTKAEAAPAGDTPRLSIVKSWQTEFRGQTFRVDQLHLHDDSNGRVQLKSRLRSGEFALLLQNRADAWDVILDPDQSTVVESSDKFMVDRDGQFTVRYTGSGQSASLVGPGGEHILKGTPTTPKVWPTKFLADGSLLFARKGEDPLGYPLRFYVLREGRETEITLPGVDAQTTAITWMTDQGLYAKYSLGSADGWRYHPFVYDLINGTTTPLPHGPVVGTFSNGDLITRPLETTVTKTKDGIDHDTHDDGTVVVESPSGQTRKIDLEGKTTFPWVFTLGDLLILERVHTSAFDDLWFLDSNLEPCDPFPFLNLRVASIKGSDDGKCVLARAFNPKEESMDYYLISLVEP